jgi:long-chain acyl-CoA synthetase
MKTLAEIEAELIGPGGMFEIVEEEVLGERLPVFKDRPRSLREILAASAGHGDTEFLVCEDLRISFARHVEMVASVARVLAEDYGVGKGDRVAILGANCPEWIVTFWATLSLGAIAVGLNGWWVRDEILYGIADSDPKVVVGDRRRLERIADADVDVPIVVMEEAFPELWERHSGANLPDTPIDEGDPATILYTSGTTGRPKGAVCTHGNIVALTRIQIYHGLRGYLWNMERGLSTDNIGNQICVLNTTPLFHVSGLFAGVITSLASGVKTVWTRGRFDPERVMRIIQDEKVTSWGPMGTMLHRVLNHPDLASYDLTSIVNIGSGGAPVSAELLERTRETFPSARQNMGIGYGLTECTALATLNFGDELEERPGSVGRALPTVTVEIRDPDGNVLPEGEEGEIYIRGPMVMKEYWRRPEETARTVLPGRWLRSGDIGWMKDGYLYIASRKRDLILRGAENIYPVEIEQCLEAHPKVAEAAVIGVEHEELGQEVKAIVVPAEGTDVSPEELRDWVAERLAYFKVPAHWEIRHEPLPRNAAGKILKHVLAEAAANLFVDE